jgi:hypothetical protein
MNIVLVLKKSENEAMDAGRWVARKLGPKCCTPFDPYYSSLI